MSVSGHEAARLNAALFVCIWMAMLPHAAQAVSPKRSALSSTAWSDLGTGPMMCQAYGQPVSVSIAETLPDTNDAGFTLGPSTSPITLIPSTAAAHIWAKASAANSIAVITCEAAGNSVVSQAGSTGTDSSVNAASIPAAGLSLLQTIAANPSRLAIEIQNQSSGLIQIVRDDGAGNNQTSILLSSGGAAGTQGGGWSSMSFKGRLRIYGSPGAQVSAYQD